MDQSYQKDFTKDKFQLIRYTPPKSENDTRTFAPPSYTVWFLVRSDGTIYASHLLQNYMKDKKLWNYRII
jgi:hypothetical protein